MYCNLNGLVYTLSNDMIKDSGRIPIATLQSWLLFSPYFAILIIVKASLKYFPELLVLNLWQDAVSQTHLLKGDGFVEEYD